MRLVLGSVQFGMNYGILKNKKINFCELKKIKNLSIKSKIRFIDTASSYGKSEALIAKSKLSSLNVITKIKLPKIKNLNIKNWIDKEINKSLTELKISRVYAILIHDYKDLLGVRGKKYLYFLQKLKKKKIIKKIGLSIYSHVEIKKIWKFWKPDIVQVPFNVIDNRILSSGWLEILKRFKIKIFARSIFLQGLLINKHDNLKFNKKHKMVLNRFKQWCFQSKISPVKACLHFVKQFKNIDYLIVGLNNYKHLKQIIDCYNEHQLKIPKIFSTNDLNLIDPRRWS